MNKINDSEHIKVSGINPATAHMLTVMSNPPTEKIPLNIFANVKRGRKAKYSEGMTEIEKI